MILRTIKQTVLLAAFAGLLAACNKQDTPDIPESRLFATPEAAVDAFVTALERAVSERLGFSEKLESARLQMVEQLRQERDARQAALFVALQPGALFLGRAEPLASALTSAL